MKQRGTSHLPSVSTLAAILKRRGMVEKEESLKRQPFTRFEREEPNELWQVDFKGPFAIGRGKCHPLTVVDDHSRYALGVTALAGESGEVTRPALTGIFRQYGLPRCLLLDNGSCWGRVEASYTAFTAWLLRLGVRVIYARPYHPQTKGKNERFNQTLKLEAIGGRLFNSLEDCQRQFDQFLVTYNTIRPHEAIDMAVPAHRYRVSPHSFPEVLPPIEYLESDIIRKVGPAGYLSWSKQRFHVGRAFSGDPVAMRPTHTDGMFEVYYCYQRIAIIDRRDGSCQQT
jgi:transposase InsO family protein